MLQAVMNAFRLPDLRRRILFTIGILVIYRFLAHIPVPGVDLTLCVLFSIRPANSARSLTCWTCSLAAP